MADTSLWLPVPGDNHPNESHIVLRCTYNKSQVRPLAKEMGTDIVAKRAKEAKEGGGAAARRVAHFNAFLRQAMKLCLVIFKML